jgi:hypothetical protein
MHRTSSSISAYFASNDRSPSLFERQYKTGQQPEFEGCWPVSN